MGTRPSPYIADEVREKDECQGAQDNAAARVLLRNGRVYHLFSRLVYRAIGRENLRNRREHSAEHMRAKLAVLDFVLAHLD